MLNRNQFCLIFADTELCEYLDSKHVRSDYLRNTMEKIVLQILNDQVNRETLIEQAKSKGIKNFTRIPKQELLEKIWQYDEPIDKVNIKRIKTCNKRNTKKSDTKENSISLAQQFINPNPIVPSRERVHAIDEDNGVCDVCNSPCQINKCSSKYMFCEKMKMYSTKRIDNTIYDWYYNCILPIDPSMNRLHYEDIEFRKQRIRNLQKLCLEENRCDNLKFYVEEVQFCYPSLLTEDQKKLMTPGEVRLVNDNKQYIVLRDFKIQEFNSDDRCCLCNKKYNTTGTLCSKKHMYCQKKSVYYYNHNENEIYDSFYDMNIAITKTHRIEGCNEIENKRQYIREFKFNHKCVNKQSFSEICTFVFLVQDYYPCMLTSKHKSFIDVVGYRYREYSDVTVKYTINDLIELLDLNMEYVKKPESMCDV